MVKLKDITDSIKNKQTKSFIYNEMKIIIRNQPSTNAERMRRYYENKKENEIKRTEQKRTKRVKS